MMINGHINFKIEEGGGRTPQGELIPVTVTWSEDIPCMFEPNHSSSRGSYDGGTFTQSQYSIHIEMRELPSFDTIRLFDSRGRRLGWQRDEDKRELPLLSPPEYLDVVGQIKLMV